MLDQYFDYVPKTLMTFQHLEEAVRQYLMRCEVMIATRMRGITNYKHLVEKIQKMSLGQLVDRFEMFSDNSSLISEIRVIIQDRNFLAHKSYLAAYSREGNPKESGEIESLLDCTTKANERAEKCIFAMWKEIQELEKRFILVQKDKSSNVS